jgi:hypothetical protein
LHFWEKQSISKSARGNGVAQVVEHLPHKHEALSPNPSTAKKQRTSQMISHWKENEISTVISATWEANIKRIMIQGQPRQTANSPSQ